MWCGKVSCVRHQLLWCCGTLWNHEGLFVVVKRSSSSSPEHSAARVAQAVPCFLCDMMSCGQHTVWFWIFLLRLYRFTADSVLWCSRHDVPSGQPRGRILLMRCFLRAEPWTAASRVETPMSSQSQLVVVGCSILPAMFSMSGRVPFRVTLPDMCTCAGQCAFFPVSSVRLVQCPVFSGSS